MGGGACNRGGGLGAGTAGAGAGVAGRRPAEGQFYGGAWQLGDSGYPCAAKGGGEICGEEVDNVSLDIDPWQEIQGIAPDDTQTGLDYACTAKRSSPENPLSTSAAIRIHAQDHQKAEEDGGSFELGTSSGGAPRDRGGVSNGARGLQNGDDSKSGSPLGGAESVRIEEPVTECLGWDFCCEQPIAGGRRSGKPQHHGWVQKQDRSLRGLLWENQRGRGVSRTEALTLAVEDCPVKKRPRQMEKFIGSAASGLGFYQVECPEKVVHPVASNKNCGVVIINFEVLASKWLCNTRFFHLNIASAAVLGSVWLNRKNHQRKTGTLGNLADRKAQSTPGAGTGLRCTDFSWISTWSTTATSAFAGRASMKYLKMHPEEADAIHVVI